MSIGSGIAIAAFWWWASWVWKSEEDGHARFMIFLAALAMTLATVTQK